MIKPELKQIYEVYREVKRPLQSYSSAKSLKKSSSKPNLKRQSSSPYLNVIDTSHAKVSRSKSPKRKNKSVDMIKLKHSNIGSVGVRNKLGVSFELMKRSAGDLFSQIPRPYKKDKENKESGFLKKKKIVHAYLKS